MNRHKKFRIIIDLDTKDPLSSDDLLPFVSRSFQLLPPGIAQSWVAPLDYGAKPEQDGFDRALFGTSHLSRGQS